MKYLKIWTDFADIISPLKNEEIGRLFIGMLNYAKTGEEPADLPGNERFLWPVAKRDIDNASEWNETCRLNGMKGGRPRKNPIPDKPEATEENPEKPNETQSNPEEPTDNLKEKKIKENKRNENIFFSEDEAAGIQKDHDRIFEAASDAGFKGSNSERAGLLNLYAEYGLEKMLSGISECVTHSAPNLAYLTAVLKGTGKKQKESGYSQRDYSGAQAEAMERMMNSEW